MKKPSLTSRVARGLREIHALASVELDNGTAGAFDFPDGGERSASLRRAEIRTALDFLDKLAAWHEQKRAEPVESERLLFSDPEPTPDEAPRPPALPHAATTDTRVPFAVVYLNPSDYPGRFVVRRWALEAGGLLADLVPTAVVGALDEARAAVAAIMPSTAVRIPRSKGDDPTIFETWV